MLWLTLDFGLSADARRADAALDARKETLVAADTGRIGDGAAGGRNAGESAVGCASRQLGKIGGLCNGQAEQGSDDESLHGGCEDRRDG